MNPKPANADLIPKIPTRFAKRAITIGQNKEYMRMRVARLLEFARPLCAKKPREPCHDPAIHADHKRLDATDSAICSSVIDIGQHPRDELKPCTLSLDYSCRTAGELDGLLSANSYEYQI
jgi:hypothetical protein